VEVGNVIKTLGGGVMVGGRPPYHEGEVWGWLVWLGKKRGSRFLTGGRTALNKTKKKKKRKKC